MTGVSFKVEFDAKQIEKFITSLSKFNAKDLLDNVGALVETQTQDRFETKTAPDGKKWAEWSKRYKKSGKGIELLRNTQRLFSSINYQVNGNKVVIGTNLEYAATHQYGDKNRNIPKRSFLGLSKQNKKDINNLVKLYIEDLKNG